MTIKAGVKIGRTGNRRRFERVGRQARVLRAAGQVPGFQAETVTASMHRILRQAWRIEVEEWALNVIRRVNKDTRMTAGTLIPIGEVLGPPSEGFIKTSIRGGRTKKGHFLKPQLGAGPPPFNRFGLRNKETGARQSRGSVKVNTGSATRPVFSFTWDYGAWQHILMDFGASGTVWEGSPLRTTQSATADFIENIKAIWAQNGLDFARFWVVAGDEAAEELADRQSRGRTLSNIGDQIIGR